MAHKTSAPTSRHLTRVFIALSVVLTCVAFYITNYALFCSAAHTAQGSVSRILLFGDPQLEGNHRIMREGWKGEFSVNMDHLYMSHVACNALKHFRPTHVVVLGDLISYQRVDDVEFDLRAKRYAAMFDFARCMPDSKRPVFINVTGNHDIGYGAEFTRSMIDRFERYYGPVNDQFTIRGHLLAVVNAMNVDPATDRYMREQTLKHVKELGERATRDGHTVILLEHIPLAKPDGACVDPWLYKTTRSGAVMEQNHISHEGTAMLLGTLRPKFVFNGHDHEGCYYQHNNTARSHEYTVRSMMGDFGGHSVVLDIDDVPDSRPRESFGMQGEYGYRVTKCSFVPIKTLWGAVVLAVAWAVTSLAMLWQTLCKR